MTDHRNTAKDRAQIQHMQARQCREVAGMLDDRHARVTIARYAEELDRRAEQLEKAAQPY